MAIGREKIQAHWKYWRMHRWLFYCGTMLSQIQSWTSRAIRDISISFRWHFLAKVNPFELSPAESRFPFTKPFTRVSVVEYLIFQCEPESMITCIVIANEEIRRDSSKFKVLYEQSSAKRLGRCNRFSELTINC